MLFLPPFLKTGPFVSYNASEQKRKTSMVKKKKEAEGVGNAAVRQRGVRMRGGSAVGGLQIKDQMKSGQQLCIHIYHVIRPDIEKLVGSLQPTKHLKSVLPSTYHAQGPTITRFKPRTFWLPPPKCLKCF